MAFLENDQVAERLKNHREALNLSARKFAVQAGVDPSQYRKIENVELPITENIAQKLAQRYGLRREWILFGTNVPHETHLLSEPKNPYSTNLKSPGDLKDRFISALERENTELRKNLDISLAALDQKIEAAAGLQMAILEILMVMAQEPGRKTVYNKTVEILKKRKLEGSLI